MKSEDCVLIEPTDDDLTCALCCDESAHLRITLTSATGKVFVLSIGPNCRLHLEGGLRAQRKWEVRGGKEFYSSRKQKQSA